MGSHDVIHFTDLFPSDDSECACRGEGVDETNFESRVFPWSSAVAERLWSPADQSSSTDEAEPRLAAFRCLLVRRGIKAAPIGPGAPC